MAKSEQWPSGQVRGEDRGVVPVAVPMKVVAGWSSGVAMGPVVEGHAVVPGLKLRGQRAVHVGVKSRGMRDH